MKKCKLILSVLILITTLTGCYEAREKRYYSDETNYITDEAIVDNIIYLEE